MVDQRVSALPAATTVTANDTIFIDQAGVSRRATIGLLPAPGTEYVQAGAASTWGPIAHNLGRRPNVTVYDVSGNQIAPDIYASTTTVSLVFATPVAGTAVLT